MCTLHASEEATQALLPARFVLVSVVGSLFALFGMVANALLAALFLTRLHYRHSPFFFLGFVALFDTLLDAIFIFLMATPLYAEFTERETLLSTWLQWMPLLFFTGQISKMASVFCLIVASIERYCMTKHWTFTGFESRTRWTVLCVVVAAAVLLKLTTLEVVLIERPNCTDPLRMFAVGTRTAGGDDPQHYSRALSILSTASIGVPFLTLVGLNGGIVFMLRRQHVQQLRSLITELTMGHDVMRLRRRNLRSATNTLLAIITAYLISNSLHLVLTIAEFAVGFELHNRHPVAYRLAADLASVLTVVGNAIRCPLHFASNTEIRQQFAVLLFGEECIEKAKDVAPPSTRRRSERHDNPFLSLILAVQADSDDRRRHSCECSPPTPTEALPNSPFLLAVPAMSSRMSFRRHSQIAII